jgi:ABC-type glycerol-3-phosphate transport system substrate-binding protein
MMKKMRILLSLICLAALLCGLLAGCGEGPQPTGPVDGDLDAKIAAEPKKVSILVPGFDGSDPDSVYSKAIKRFEAKYGKKVEILQAVGEQLWNEKVAAQIAANDPVDVFYISVDQYLGMYLKNYLLPVDEYVDLNHPLNNKEVMDSFVKFDGKYPAGTLFNLRFSYGKLD